MYEQLGPFGLIRLHASTMAARSPTGDGNAAREGPARQPVRASSSALPSSLRR